MFLHILFIEKCNAVNKKEEGNGCRNHAIKTIIFYYNELYAYE